MTRLCWRGKSAPTAEPFRRRCGAVTIRATTFAINAVSTRWTTGRTDLFLLFANSINSTTPGRLPAVITNRRRPISDRPPTDSEATRCVSFYLDGSSFFLYKPIERSIQEPIKDRALRPFTRQPAFPMFGCRLCFFFFYIRVVTLRPNVFKCLFLSHKLARPYGRVPSAVS